MSIKKPTMIVGNVGPEKRTKEDYCTNSMDVGIPLPLPEGSPDIHVSYLQQGISAYLDAIQSVCKYGSWISEAIFIMLDGTNCKESAQSVRKRFKEICKQSVTLHSNAKSEFANILMDLTIPNHNNNNHTQVCKWKYQNAKVLEKCILFLESVQQTIFKTFLYDNNPNIMETEKVTLSRSVELSPHCRHCLKEWNSLCDVRQCCRSWIISRQKTESLRKSPGLTEYEIQNLLKSSPVSESYLKKLNMKISSSLKNYETTIRSLVMPIFVVNGAFYISPNEAKDALQNCCTSMEIEQGIQRLPVAQFLDCELPLINFKISQKEFSSDSQNSLENSNLKKKAVAYLVHETNPTLNESEAHSLSCEILGEICPARWRSHVKATLQLIFGNAGLVLLDTINSNLKESPSIMRKSTFLIVSIPSTWCVKEDPGTMILLHRLVDPDKSITEISVRYVAVYNILQTAKFEPGIFVEIGLKNQTEKKKKNFTSTSFWLNEVPFHNVTIDKSPNKCKKGNVTVAPSSTLNEEVPYLEEGVQDAIKLLSGSGKVRSSNSELPKFDSCEQQQVSPNAEIKDSSPATSEILQVRSCTPSSHLDSPGKIYKQPSLSSVRTSKSNSLPCPGNSYNNGPLARKSFNQMYHGGKSASFSAFDKSMRLRNQRPLLLIRNPHQTNSRMPDNTYFQGVSPRNNSTTGKLIVPNSVPSIQPQYLTGLPLEQTIIPQSMFIPHLQNLGPCQLQSPTSPFTYMHNPHPSVMSSGNFRKTNSMSPVQGFKKQMIPHQQLLSSNCNPEILGNSQLFCITSTNVKFTQNNPLQSFVQGPYKQNPPSNCSMIRNVDNLETNSTHDNFTTLTTTSKVLFDDQHNTKMLDDSSLNSRNTTDGITEVINSSIESLGPIGSPVTPRRVASLESKGSNTWPNTYTTSNKPQMFDEPEYLQYVTDIQNAFSRKSLDLRSSNSSEDESDLAADRNTFKMFCTPDLVQHVIPRKPPTEKSESDETVRFT